MYMEEPTPYNKWPSQHHTLHSKEKISVAFERLPISMPLSEK